jgi:hypothetical protein
LRPTDTPFNLLRIPRVVRAGADSIDVRNPNRRPGFRRPVNAGEGDMSARQIIVTLGAVEGIAVLFDDLAPKTCAAVRAALPMTGTINHANFSGEEVSFPTSGLMWEREHQLIDCQPGDLGYFVQGPAICIYYGALRVISPGNVFGRITGNLPRIQEVARRSWKEPGIPISMRWKDA